MNHSIQNFNCEKLSKIVGYEDASNTYLNRIQQRIWDDISKNYTGAIPHTIYFLVIGVIITGISGEPFALLYTPIWLISILSVRSRRNKAFQAELKRNAKDTDEDKIAVLYILTEKEDLKRLGKVFSITHNEVTGKEKKVDIGYVFISFIKNKIYILKDKELCQKNFKVSDIVSFKSIQFDADNKVDYTSDMGALNNAEHRANILRAEAKLTQVTGGAYGTLHDNIRADKARIHARKERERLEKKIESDEQKIKDETNIKILQFSDNDIFLISHLNDWLVDEIEQRIENH